MPTSRDRIRGRVIAAALVALLALALLWWWSVLGPGRDRFRDAPPAAGRAAPAE